MKTFTKFQAAYSLVGPNIWGTDDEVYYDSDQTPPTDAEIDAELIRLQTEYDAQEYARKRKIEYDALNQFELMTDDAANGTTTHADAITAIKTKYPKG